MACSDGRVINQTRLVVLTGAFNKSTDFVKDDRMATSIWKLGNQFS